MLRLSLEDPLTLIGLTTVLYWFVRSYWTVRKVCAITSGKGVQMVQLSTQLNQFPTVGTTLPFLSLIGTLRLVRNVQTVVEVGARKVGLDLAKCQFSYVLTVLCQLVATPPVQNSGCAGLVGHRDRPRTDRRNQQSTRGGPVC